MLGKALSLLNMSAKPQFDSPAEEDFYNACRREGIFGLRHHTRIGPYEADFTIQRGVWLWRKKWIIEIDGHPYHSSKAQRAHDAKRERYLAALGWNVIRFTGSEVYRDAGHCASELKKLIAGGIE